MPSDFAEEANALAALPAEIAVAPDTPFEFPVVVVEFYEEVLSQTKDSHQRRAVWN
jgi:hypothetical protein